MTHFKRGVRRLCSALRSAVDTRKIAPGETGQAAIFATLLIPAAIVGVLMVFNTGQVTANKLRAQNAADAAAFSAMELQARQMNLDAYLNRAMLMNQIAIGQAVSIASWSRYVKHAGEGISDLIRPFSAVPGVGALINGLANAVKGYTAGLDLIGETYANAYLAAANLYDAVYSGASSIFNASVVGVPGLGGAVAQTVSQVVELNAPGARAVALDLANLKYWADRRNYVTTWGGSKYGDGNGDPGGLARMAGMVNDGAQEFVRNRDHDVGFPFSFSLFPVLPFRANTHKYGGSQFALKDPNDPKSGYVWSGADTISTRLQMKKLVLFGGWRDLYNASWGWGGAWSYPAIDSFDYYQGSNKNWSYPYMRPDLDAASKTLMQARGQVYAGAWSGDSRGMRQVVRDYSERLPGDYVNPGALGIGRGAQGGIASYRDLKWGSKGRDDMTDSAPRYLVLVDIPKARLRDSETALGIRHDPDANNSRLGWLNIHLESQGAGREPGIRAAAAAQVYFRRPESLWGLNQGLDERANLFSPFWAARLVDLDAGERAALAALSSQQ